MLLRRADASCTTEDVTQEAPDNGAYIKHRWLRGPPGAAGRCFLHPELVATLQCVGSKRFYCNSVCFYQGWREWIKSRQGEQRRPGLEEA